MQLKNSILVSLVMLTVAILGLSSNQVFAQTAYDGEWTARVYSYSGGCKKQYTFPFEVVEGKISGTVKGNQGLYTFEGVVDDNGVMDVDLLGPEKGKFTGEFSAKKAKGIWQSKSCNGSFKFKKKT